MVETGVGDGSAMMRDLGYWMLAMFQNRSGTCYSTVMVGSDRAYRARPVSHRWRAAARGVTFVQHTCSSCAAASRRTAPAVGESFGGHDTIAAHAAHVTQQTASDDLQTVTHHVGDSKKLKMPRITSRVIPQLFPISLHHAPQTHPSGVPKPRQASDG